MRYHAGASSGSVRSRAKQPPVAAETRPEGIELAEAAILYFGVTLSPLFVAILLYQWGVIA